MSQLSAKINPLLNILNQPITSSNEAAGEAAAIQLGQLGVEALPTIDNLLNASNPDQRFWGIRALWANGSPAAQNKLLRHLTDPDELIQSVAVMALGELKATAAIAPLQNIVTSNPGSVGNHAADALAKIGPPAADALIAALQHPEPWVRVRAVKALVPVESKAAIRPLIHALDHDDSYLVRHYADVALKRMGVGEMVYFK